MKIFLFVFAMGIGSVCHAQFSLEGKMTNTKLDKVYLSYSDGKGAMKIDSANVQNGKFRFSGNIKEIVFATLSGVLGREMYNSNGYGTVVLEPARITLDMADDNFQGMKVKGSASHTEFAFVNDKTQKLRKRWKVVMDTLSEVNKRSNWEFQEMKNWVLKPYEAEMEEIFAGFFNKYPSSVVTAYYLNMNTRAFSEDSLRKMYNRLSAQAKQSAAGKAIFADLENKKKGAPGTMAADFTATDINGHPLKLSDYKGRYVLLDFWASWCVPCRKGNPHLIKLYNQYKGQGFEIIGISDDDRKEELWRSAVAKDNIGIWKHVLRGLDMEKRIKGQANPNDISEKYNISTLPTKILIDKDGKIIGRYGSEEEALDKKLAELMPGGSANVTGHIRNLKDSISIYWFDETGPKSETVKVVDERFTWSRSFSSPQKIMLATSMRYMQFFAENGNITITGSADSLYFCKVSGSVSQDEYTKFNQLIDPVKSAQYPLFAAMRKTEDKTQKADLERRIDSISAVVDERKKKYVMQFPSSPVSLSIVDDISILGDYPKVNSYFQLLSTAAKQTTIGKKLAERVDVLKRSTIGSEMKDFTLNTMDGKTIRMSDFRGKYVLVDFWASWCTPCRAENPNVSRAYEQFKSKNFTVLGISIDEKVDKWKEAVEKDKMPWTQVLNSKQTDNDAASYYGIKAIPATMLLDTDGKIIALNLRGEKLHEELKKILK